MLTVENGLLAADILAVNDWDGFDSLIRYLERYFNAEVFERLDGPDARIWKFVIDNHVLTLKNNPYGNYLMVEKESDHGIFYKIVEDIDKRFSE